MTAPDADGRTVDCGLARSGAHLAAGWPGVYGPAVAELQGSRALRHLASHHLGRAPLAAESVPALAFCGERLVAAFTRFGGAWIAVAGAPRPRLLASEARAVGLHAERKLIRVVVVDGEGIVLSTHASSGALRGERQRVVRRRNVGRVLRVLRTPSGILVLYALVDVPELGVCFVGPNGARDVRHRLAAPCRALDAALAGSTTLVVLGTEEERIEVASLDSEGGTLERPHTWIHERGRRLASPHALWLDDAFAVAFVDAAAGQLRIEPLGPPGKRLVVPGVGASCSVAYHGRRILAARIHLEGEAATLRLRVSDLRGSIRDERKFDVTPEDTSTRRSQHRSAAALEQLRARLASSGYRASAVAIHLAEDGLGIQAHRGEAVVHLRLSPRPDAVELELIAARGAPHEPPPTPSLVRLARWVREKLNRRDLADVDAEFAARTLLDGVELTLQRVDRTPASLQLRAACPAVPSTAVVERWVRNGWAWAETSAVPAGSSQDRGLNRPD